MPDRGTHWRMLYDNIDEIASHGFDSMWLPPPQKTRAGYPATGGYEPYDYYDLGAYYQKGRVRTLFGTQQELIDLIAAANERNIGAIIDTVVNHRVGGDLEYNPFVGDYTPTNFMNVASGKLKMNYTHFWPNSYGSGDAGQYGDFPDISHKNPEVQTMLIEWAKWLRDEIGFDGYRFDSAQFIDPAMIQYWMQNVSRFPGEMFGVDEYWMYTPDPNEVLDYVHKTNDTTYAMDFALLEAMRKDFNTNGTGDISTLVDQGVSNIDPSKAVTFVVNHDTYRDKFNIRDNRRLLGYAYIMTHPGYPSVFYMDYVNPNLRNLIIQLVKIHNEHAYGNLTRLFVNQDIYVAQRSGDDSHAGLVIAITDQEFDAQNATVTTKWKNTRLYNLLNASDSILSDENGTVSLTIPAGGFLIYSPDPTLQTNIDLKIPKGIAQYPDNLSYAQISVDGEPELQWGTPASIDQLEDLQISDLRNLYLKQDDSNLYVGFSYVNFYNWTKGPVDFEIAVDVKKGGSNDHPYRSQVRFGGLSDLPDYLFRLETDFADNGYARVVNSIEKYKFDSNWQSVPTSITTASHPMMGFIEVAIPFEELGLDGNTGISVKVISALSNSSNVLDSIPTDLTIEKDQTSWIFMPQTFQITLPEISTPIGMPSSETSSQPVQTISSTTALPIPSQFSVSTSSSAYISFIASAMAIAVVMKKRW